MELSKLDGALEILVDYGDIPTITLHGEVDFRNMDKVSRAISGLVERGKTAIRVDVRELEFVDSTGLSALVDAARTVLPKGGEITLVSPSAQLVRVLDRCGFSNVLRYERITEMHQALLSPDKELVGDVIEFEVPNRPEMISHIRARVAEFARSMPFTQDDIEDIKLAVGEAGTNALRHGVNPEWCKVFVRSERHDDSIKILVADKGCGFNPDAMCPPESGELKLSGRGIMFMRAVMDKVTFHFDDPGTCVELVKRFSDIAA